MDYPGYALFGFQISFYFCPLIPTVKDQKHKYVFFYFMEPHGPVKNRFHRQNSKIFKFLIFIIFKCRQKILSTNYKLN